MSVIPNMSFSRRQDLIYVVLLDEDFQGTELIYDLMYDNFTEARSVDASCSPAVYTTMSLNEVDFLTLRKVRKIIEINYDLTTSIHRTKQTAVATHSNRS